jgi:hypothetical protein
VLFGYKPFWFIFEKLFETKTLVLVFKVDFGCPPPFGEGDIRKIAERQNIYILEVRGFLYAPFGASEKLKPFYWLDGFYKNNQVINELKNNSTN